MRRAGKTLSEAAAAVQWIPAAEAGPVQWRELFRREAPGEGDLGCGDGSFFIARAEQQPGRNFLGVERLLGRTRAACRAIAARGLTNARITRIEITHLVEHLLPPASVDAFYLLFPDPWPKRRHQPRRVVTPPFLQAIAQALRIGGRFRIATDQADYYAAIVRLVSEVSEFEPISELNEETLPRSTFEKRFRATGEKIHRLVLRRVSDVR